MHLRRACVCVLLGFALVVSACSNSPASDNNTNNTTTTEPGLASADATVPLVTTTTEAPLAEPLLAADIPGEPLNQFLLEADDCFERIDDLEQGRPITRTTRLGCGEAHHFQVFHRLNYPAAHPSVFPGDTVVRQFAIESCYREFGLWVGQDYEVSALEIDVIVPNRSNFEDNNARYRGIHCLVERLDGEPMIGTARDSGW